MTFIVLNSTMINHVACLNSMVGRRRPTLEKIRNSSAPRATRHMLVVIRIKFNSGRLSTNIEKDEL